VKMGNADQVDVTKEMREQMARQVQGVEAADLLRSLQVFNRAATEGKANWMPALPVEMAFIEVIEKPAEEAVVVAQPPAAVEKARLAHRKADRLKDTPPEPQAAPEQQAGGEEIAQVGSQASRKLDENWRTILAQLKKVNPNLSALMNSTKTHHLENNLLTLGFATEVLKMKMEKQENLQTAQVVLKEVFNEEILIRCVVLTGKQTTPPPGVDSDGMVASALRDLGGEIVDIQ
jgi:DNA polymerase III gamma/tau subunit